MYRRAFARHRTGAAVLLGLSLRAPSAPAEPAEPDETRVGTVEGKAAEALPIAAETPPILAAPIVAPRLIRDEGIAYPEQALGERFYERVEVSLILELDASGHVRSSSVETPHGHGFDEEATRAAVLVPARIRYRYIFEVPDATLIETPFARGGSLYSYGAALLSLLRPEVKLDDRDYQARATYEPSVRDRFSVFGLGSYDPLGEKRNGIMRRLGDACRPRITFTW